VKDIRIGESLWFIWDGDEYEPNNAENYLYYTEDHVDLEEDVVINALASSMQRDGITYSMGQGAQLLNSATVVKTFAGSIDGDYQLTICFENGTSVFSGVELENVIPITIVEVPELD